MSMDLPRIYAHRVSEPCSEWTHCGSHCCQAGKIFRGLDSGTHLAVLPIPEVEWQELKARVPNEDWWAEPARKVSITLGGRTLRFRLQPCNLGGRCNASIRPLICRLYPYMPYVGSDGRVQELTVPALVDLLWGASPAPDPCLMRTPDRRQAYIDRWNDLLSELSVADRRELCLWLNVSYLYVEAFRAAFQEALVEAKAGSHDEAVKVLLQCQRSQLFLGDSDFQARVEDEVAKWSLPASPGEMGP